MRRAGIRVAISFVAISVFINVLYAQYVAIPFITFFKTTTFDDVADSEAVEGEQHFITFAGTNLTASRGTVVTAFFPLDSKYPIESYTEWMEIMLSLQDAMVIYTTEEWTPIIQGMREHAKNRTYIVSMKLEDVPLAKKYSIEQWQHELDHDVEKEIHKSWELFWIWLSKLYFTTQAIRVNPFASEYFMWSDIGCYRREDKAHWRNKQVFLHFDDVIPQSRILFAAWKNPNPPPTVWWTNKTGEDHFFYHAGAMMAGRYDLFEPFYDAFMNTVDGFIERDLFVGDDQTVLQSTCLQNRHLCVYLMPGQVRDNPWFALRMVLHLGGSYRYWYPTLLNVTAAETSQVQ